MQPLLEDLVLVSNLLHVSKLVRPSQIDRILGPEFTQQEILDTPGCQIACKVCIRVL